MPAAEQATILMSILSKTDFQNFFTAGKRTKFQTYFDNLCMKLSKILVFQVSQGSAAKHLRQILYSVCWKFSFLSNGERILEIGYMTKIQPTAQWHGFFLKHV
jgi:hypothetical protein